jgi:shikimate dehydrogenase
VVRPLLEELPAQLVIVNRTAAKAVELAQSLCLSGVVEGRGFDVLTGGRYDILINAASAEPSDAALALPGNLFASGALAYDMVYGKGVTPFLRQAAAAGARTVDGLGMLVEQAAESFFVWRGVRPDTRPVLDALRATPQTAGA